MFSLDVNWHKRLSLVMAATILALTLTSFKAKADDDGSGDDGGDDVETCLVLSPRIQI